MDPPTPRARPSGLPLPTSLRPIADPADDEVTRILKELFALAHVLVALPASLIYALAFLAGGVPAGAAVTLGFALGMLVAAMVLAQWPERFALAASISVFSLLALSLVRPFVLGAYPNYATGTLWGIVGLCTILAIVPRALPAWFGAWALIVLVVVTLTPIVSPDTQLPLLLQQALAVGDIVTAASIAVVILTVSLRERRVQQERADGLLDAILPREIGRILKRRPRVIAQRFEAASILFADAVDFTPLSATLAPEELVGMLDEVFSDFDAVVEQAGLEKIKTVGDTYMVAAGVPEPRGDHAEALVRVALELRDITRSRTYRGHRLVFRFGINSGPVVAGVIGRRKFAYDLWGDAVNVASRMESHGVGGEIHLTESTRALLGNRFDLEPIGPIELKGRGPMEAWRVVRVRPG